jgi:tRNA(His) guanylyltransferase
MSDDLGDRMKEYERAEAGRRLMARLPICVRIDGKRFSRFTEGLRRPYDERLSQLMVATTRYLVEESAALAGYTQSDEISLLYYDEDPKSQLFLDRRIQKLTSILASMTTGYFNAHLAEKLPEKAGELALFDSRVWSVPSKDEAANTFLWRELDATKNSISMAARAFYSHGELHNRNSSQLQELLFQKGVNWNDYPSFFKRGTFLLRRTIERRFTADELAALPPRHAARTNPDLIVTRSEVRAVDMPPFGRLTNRVGVLFDGEEPRLAEVEAKNQPPSASQ